jgi:hypothetical protein
VLAQSTGTRPRADYVGSNPTPAANSPMRGRLAEGQSAIKFALSLKCHGLGKVAVMPPRIRPKVLGGFS